MRNGELTGEAMVEEMGILFAAVAYTFGSISRQSSSVLYTIVAVRSTR